MNESLKQLKLNLFSKPFELLNACC